MFIFYSNDDTIPGATNLNDLNDVAIASPQAGQVLSYDGNQYINSDINADNITSGTLNIARLPYLEQTLNNTYLPPYIQSISDILSTGANQIIEIIGQYFTPITELSIQNVIINSLNIRSPNKIVANISTSNLSGNISILLNNGYNNNNVWTDGIKSITIYSDPYFNNVSLLLKGNGDNNSINIIDSSLNPKIISRIGDTKLSTIQSKLGGSSIYFDGSGDYLGLPNSGFSLSNDFTLEFWVYASDRANRGILGYESASGFYLNNKFLFWKDGIGEILSNNVTNCPLNTWTHIAYVRINGVLSLFQNGVKIAFANFTSAIDLNSKNIGQRTYSSDFIGYLDSFRITQGVGRYTNNFNPETETFLN